MNPDNFNNKTAEYITYIMLHPDGDHTVAFHVWKDHVEIISSMGPSRVSLESARKSWKELVRRGFTVSNKSVVHDMEKFHNMKREEEKNESYSTPLPKHVDDYLKEYIENADLQEMRINPKEFWKKNYALEA